VQEGKPGPAAAKYVSKGLTRSRTDKLSVLTGGAATTPTSSAEGLQLRVTAVASRETRAEVAGTAALKAELVQKLSPAEQLEELTAAQSEVRAHARAEAAEKRAEAKAKGYDGEACGECGNFTLVRNGTCLKCDTCGATTGCS
jgi:ribonucleoside-diphosphate reductase alpha chain